MMSIYYIISVQISHSVRVLYLHPVLPECLLSVLVPPVAGAAQQVGARLLVCCSAYYCTNVLHRSTLEQFRAPMFENNATDPNGWSLGKLNNVREVFGK